MRRIDTASDQGEGGAHHIRSARCCAGGAGAARPDVGCPSLCKLEAQIGRALRAGSPACGQIRGKCQGRVAQTKKWEIPVWQVAKNAGIKGFFNVLRVTDPRSGVWATRPQDAPVSACLPPMMSFRQTFSGTTKFERYSRLSS